MPRKEYTGSTQRSTIIPPKSSNRRRHRRRLGIGSLGSEDSSADTNTSTGNREKGSQKRPVLRRPHFQNSGIDEYTSTCIRPVCSVGYRSAPQHKKFPSLGDVEDSTAEERCQYIGLDCEMVGVGPGGVRSAVARVSVVDYSGAILLDTFVKVNDDVTDYRTEISGVHPEDIEEGNAMDQEICRQELSELLVGRILVGHGLKNDLRALGISHPWYDVRDSAKYEPFMVRSNNSTARMLPRKLRDLAYEKLGVSIQKDGENHSSVEDARAAMGLYRSVRRKWEKVIEYKIRKTREIEEQRYPPIPVDRPNIALIPV